MEGRGEGMHMATNRLVSYVVGLVYGWSALLLRGYGYNLQRIRNSIIFTHAFWNTGKWNIEGGRFLWSIACCVLIDGLFSALVEQEVLLQYFHISTGILTQHQKDKY